MKMPYEILENPIVSAFRNQSLRITPSGTVKNPISLSTFRLLLRLPSKLTSAEFFKTTKRKPKKFIREISECRINDNKVFDVAIYKFGKTKLLQFDFTDAIKGSRYFKIDYEETKGITTKTELLLLFLSKRIQKINTQEFLVKYFLGVTTEQLRIVNDNRIVAITSKIKAVNNIVFQKANKYNATIEPGRIAVGKWTAPFPEKITFNRGKR